MNDKESAKQKVVTELRTLDVVTSQGKPTIMFRLDDEFKRRLSEKEHNDAAT